MTDPAWHPADVCEAFARVAPDTCVIAQGARRTSWREFDQRADGVAAALLDAELQRQDRVGLYLRNSPEYLETHFAASKAALVPFNTNYRYQGDELVYLWNDADAAAVVFDTEFAPLVEQIRHRVPGVRLWLAAGVDDGDCPHWAVPYESAAARPAARIPWARTGDDLVFLYTGGTTGMPKGVMWPQSSFVERLLLHEPAKVTGALAYARDRIDRDAGDVILPAPPLMHGAGLASALRCMLGGGTVVLLGGRTFDAAELWAAVERESVEIVTIVGDAMARPMCDVLESMPADHAPPSSIRTILSTGAGLSEEIKRRVLDRLPTVKIVNSLASSETSGLGSSVSRGAGADSGPRFRLDEGVRLLDEDGTEIEPGSGRVGVIATRGGAIGYHKDPERTAATFRRIDGQRYTLTGDFATIEADGTVCFVGRGSGCINTGGEKVFPEEVEEVLKTHAAVRDAVVVGVSDARLGQMVAAVVQLEPGTTVDDVIDHAKSRLAGYKAPRLVVPSDTPCRGPNGKADYATAEALVLAQQ